MQLWQAKKKFGPTLCQRKNGKPPSTLPNRLSEHDAQTPTHRRISQGLQAAKKGSFQNDCG